MDIVTGMFWILLVVIVIFFGLKTTQFMVISAYVEDALAASNLASAVIDVKEYGKSHQIIIEDPMEAYGLFRASLCRNLQLDDYLYPYEDSLLTSKLQLAEYRIYNVNEEGVEVYIIGSAGVITDCFSGKKGEVFTPDGICVTATTVYSRVLFEVKGIGEQNIQAKKEKSVDIVRYENE